MIEKNIIKENAKLAKNFKIILIMGYKYKNEISHILYKNLLNSNENILLLKNNGYYINKKYYKLNSNLNIHSFNDILKNGFNKNVKYLIIAINNSLIKNNLLKNIKYNVMCISSFIGDDTKYVLKQIKKVKDVLVLNNDEKYSKNFRKKSKNTITVGKMGNYKIDTFNKTFEYEYNIYKLNTNELNLMYAKTIAISILVYIGFDIDYLT